MKKILFILIGCLAAVFGFGQSYEVIYGPGPTPSFTPSNPYSPRLYQIVGTDSLYFYDENANAWVLLFPLQSRIADQLDVDTSGIAMNSVMKYDTTTNKWEIGTDLTSVGATGHVYMDDGTPITQRDTADFIGAELTDSGTKTSISYPRIFNGGTFTSTSTLSLLENATPSYSARFMAGDGSYLGFMSDTANAFVGLRMQTLQGVHELGYNLSGLRIKSGYDMNFVLSNTLRRYYWTHDAIPVQDTVSHVLGINAANGQMVRRAVSSVQDGNGIYSGSSDLSTGTTIATFNNFTDTFRLKYSTLNLNLRPAEISLGSDVNLDKMSITRDNIIKYDYDGSVLKNWSIFGSEVRIRLVKNSSTSGFPKLWLMSLTNTDSNIPLVLLQRGLDNDADEDPTEWDALELDDPIGNIKWSAPLQDGYSESNTFFSTVAKIEAAADQNHGSTTMGTRLDFYITPKNAQSGDVNSIKVLSMTSDSFIVAPQYSGTNNIGTPTYMLGVTSTGQIVKDTIPSGGSGETNTMSNVGSGEGIYKQKTGVDFEMKTLSPGANVTITPVGDSLVIAAQTGGDTTVYAITAATTTIDFQDRTGGLFWVSMGVVTSRTLTFSNPASGVAAEYLISVNAVTPNKDTITFPNNLLFPSGDTVGTWIADRSQVLRIYYDGSTNYYLTSDLYNIVQGVTPASSTSVTIDLKERPGGIFQIDCTTLSTASTITLTTSNPAVGVYTFHFQNTGSTNSLDLPATFLDQTGTALDGGTTYDIDASDVWFTCYHDGTNYHCK